MNSNVTFVVHPGHELCASWDPYVDEVSGVRATTLSLFQHIEVGSKKAGVAEEAVRIAQFERNDANGSWCIPVPDTLSSGSIVFVSVQATDVAGHASETLRSQFVLVVSDDMVPGTVELQVAVSDWPVEGSNCDPADATSECTVRGEDPLGFVAEGFAARSGVASTAFVVVELVGGVPMIWSCDETQGAVALPFDTTNSPNVTTMVQNGGESLASTASTAGDSGTVPESTVEAAVFDRVDAHSSGAPPGFVTSAAPLLTLDQSLAQFTDGPHSAKGGDALPAQTTGLPWSILTADAITRQAATTLDAGPSTTAEPATEQAQLRQWFNRRTATSLPLGSSWTSNAAKDYLQVCNPIVSGSNATRDSAFYFVVRVCSVVGDCAFARSPLVVVDDDAPVISIASVSVDEDFSSVSTCGRRVQTNNKTLALSVLNVDDADGIVSVDACVGRSPLDCDLLPWQPLPHMIPLERSELPLVVFLEVSLGLPAGVPVFARLRAKDAANNVGIGVSDGVLVLVPERSTPARNWTLAAAPFEGTPVVGQRPAPMTSQVTVSELWQNDPSAKPSMTVFAQNNSRLCAQVEFLSAFACISDARLVLLVADNVDTGAGGALSGYSALFNVSLGSMFQEAPNCSFCVSLNSYFEDGDGLPAGSYWVVISASPFALGPNQPLFEPPDGTPAAATGGGENMTASTSTQGGRALPPGAIRLVVDDSGPVAGWVRESTSVINTARLTSASAENDCITVEDSSSSTNLTIEWGHFGDMESGLVEVQVMVAHGRLPSTADSLSVQSLDVVASTSFDYGISAGAVKLSASLQGGHYYFSVVTVTNGAGASTSLSSNGFLAVESDDTGPVSNAKCTSSDFPIQWTPL